MNKRKLKRKNKKILFGVSLLFLVSFSIIIAGIGLQWFSPYDDYVEITDKKIRYDWLNVNLENDPTDNIEFNKGGLKLIEFENDGMYNRDDLTNEIIYKSRAVFMFEVNAYQDIDIFDVWPKINVEATQKFEYLYMVLFNPWPFVAGTYHYYITAPTIDFGSVFNSHDSDLTVPITIDIAPDFDDLTDETINGIPIKKTEYIYQVKSVEVVNIREGTCGEYEDRYTDQTYQEAKVDLDEFAKDNPSNSKALSLISESNLGVIPGETRTYTIQNSKLDTNPVGHTEVNPSSGAFVINEKFVMRPEITKNVQEYNVRYVGFEYCNFWKTSTVYGGVTQTEQERVRSAHVYNQYIHKEYKVTVNFLATVQLDAEEYYSYLSDPYLKLGDWLWDNEIGGTDEVTLVYNEPVTTQLWNSIINTLFGGISGLISLIIIIVVLIAIVYILYRIYRARKRNRMMQQYYQPQPKQRF